MRLRAFVYKVLHYGNVFLNAEALSNMLNVAKKKQNKNKREISSQLRSKFIILLGVEPL